MFLKFENNGNSLKNNNLNIELIKILDNVELLEQFYEFCYNNIDIRVNYIFNNNSNKNRIIKSIIDILLNNNNSTPFFVKTSMQDTTGQNAKYVINNYKILDNKLNMNSNNNKKKNNNDYGLNTTQGQEEREKIILQEKENEEINKIIKNAEKIPDKYDYRIIEIDLVNKSDLYNFNKSNCNSFKKLQKIKILSVKLLRILH